LPDLPLRVDPLPELFDYLPSSADGQTLREALSHAGDSAYGGPRALLHGDFWPGNLLWRDGRLVAILDWEDAALGDPACDVAGCRLELLWKYGSITVARFTERYARRRPIDARRLAWWEVFVAAAGARFMGEWGLPPEQEARMRAQAEQVVRAATSTLLRLPAATRTPPAEC
jgi:aminoglycoside phosphotransferase (APT) family kinase protein